MTFLNRVCSALRESGVRYALVGGYAVALHGAVRGTVDIDFVIAWNRRNLHRAEQVLQRLGLVSRLPISAEDVFLFRQEYIADRNLVAWNFYNPQNLSEQVDIVITYDLTGLRARKIDTSEGPVMVLPIRQLIHMKRESGRPQDLADVQALEKLV